MIPLPRKIRGSSEKRHYLGYDSKDERIVKMLSVLKLPKGDTLIKKGTVKEGYRLVFSDCVYLCAADEASLFYGLITLKQLLNKPFYMDEIYDKPSFEHRGFMLDVARHFFDVKTIKDILDMCAELKLNVFHLHLTDDQGWRVESRKYPRLHEIGSYRNRTKRRFHIENEPVTGYYTQKDIQDIVSYAKDRFIEVVPEIDVPGHFSAAIGAYPHLSCVDGDKKVRDEFGIFEDIFCVGKKGNLAMIFNLLDEVIDLFQCKRLHIGCDEVPLIHWKNCPDCNQYMKTNNVSNERQLLIAFIHQMKDHCMNRGVQLIVWNDPLRHDHLSSDIQVQHWMNRKVTEKMGQNNQVIVSDYFHHYLDYPHYMTPLDKTMTKHVLDHKDIIGYEGCLWTEHVNEVDKLYEMTLPRLLGISELAWYGEKGHDFYNRLDCFLKETEHSFTEKYNEKGFIAKIKTFVYMLKMISYHDIKNIIRMR